MILTSNSQEGKSTGIGLLLIMFKTLECGGYDIALFRKNASQRLKMLLFM